LQGHKLLRALPHQGLLDFVQPGFEPAGGFRRRFLRGFAIAFEGQFGGVKLLLKLQVRAQRFLCFGLLGARRRAGRRVITGAET